jgi:site-specific DNA recombinase
MTNCRVIQTALKTRKTILQKYADDNGFANTEFFVDDGYSGTNFDRPDWQRLLSQVEEGNVRHRHCKGHEPSW